jgi:hypothetical protein
VLYTRVKGITPRLVCLTTMDMLLENETSLMPAILRGHGYENRTKSAKCKGLETNGPRERISTLDRRRGVRRFAHDACGYWGLQRGKIQWRILLAQGLAEGENLPANPLHVFLCKSAKCSETRRTRDGFDDEHALGYATTFCCSTRTGSVKENVDPSPGLDSTQIRPPCSSTMRLEMVRPKPVPPFSRVIDDSAC